MTDPHRLADSLRQWRAARARTVGRHRAGRRHARDRADMQSWRTRCGNTPARLREDEQR